MVLEKYICDGLDDCTKVLESIVAHQSLCDGNSDIVYRRDEHQALKLIYSSFQTCGDELQKWLENNLLILVIVGLGIAAVLVIFFD